MGPAQSGENGRIKGLSSKGNPADPQFGVGPGGLPSEGGGVGFKIDLLGLAGVKDRTQSFEESSEMGGRKHAGRPAAEVDRLQFRRVEFLRPPRGLGQKGLDEAGQVGIARSVLVERAIRADSMTERNVKVEVDLVIGYLLVDSGGRKFLESAQA